MDALKAAEESAEKKIKEIQTTSEKKLSQVQKELEEKLKSGGGNQSGSSDISEKLTKVEAELAKRLLDYNSEVDKTKKLTAEVDKLSTERKTAESRLAEMEETVGV